MDVAAEYTAALASAMAAAYVAAVAAIVMINRTSERRRRRAYRDAIIRRDWGEAHRLMGLEDSA